FGRVDVLRAQRVVGPESPGTEPDDATARVGERKEQTAPEIVVAAAIDEARGRELLNREPGLSRLSSERLAAGREAEPVLAADFVAEVPPRQVLACGFAGVGVPQVPLVEAGRVLEEVVEPSAPLGSGGVSGRGLLVLEADAGAIRQPFDRTRKVEVL